MDKKRLIAVLITVFVMLGSLALIKVLPFYATLCCFASFVGGFAAGFLVKKKEVVEVEKIVEKIVEKPAKVKKKSTKKVE